MMTPAQLNRATTGYRRGYRDARDGRPNDPTNGGKLGPNTPYPLFVFEHGDYADGYKAGEIESRRFR